jgi:thiosulfate/3-mercaptopyruvate sulfurtransferase
LRFASAFILLTLGLFCIRPVEAGLPALLSPDAINGDEVVVLDLRPTEKYLKGHMPGAISAPFDEFPWRVSRYGRPAVLPEAAELARNLGKLGIGNRTAIVLVADDVGIATLVFWTLRSLGHEPLYLLDGGQKAWNASGLPVAKDIAKPLKEKAYKPMPNFSSVADESFVVDYRDNAMVPMDCRSEIYWGGEKGGSAQDDFGTIEDSINLPSEWLLDLDAGWYRPLDKIKAIYIRKMKLILPEFLQGEELQRTSVFFGYDGRHAAVCWFAIHELLGVKATRIYDGGIVDWEKNGHIIWNLQDGMGAR